MPASRLVDKLHAEIVIGCEAHGCHEVFTASESPSEPVEKWSLRAAMEAEGLGWTLSSTGMVRCPECSAKAKM